MKQISLSLLCFFSLVTSFGQTKLLVKKDKKDNDYTITYEKHLLSNGLTLVIHEDHSDPIVYVDVTYHVGSSREQEGRSGFAHFFEHMMFQGSKNVADEQHFKIVTESGGKLNGTTNPDRTNYFETLPSNQLERALWLEADRMGFLLDSVTQKKFEVQRATVKNERGQNYDNRPYGVAQEKINEALYPTNHPYAWLTIGYIEDLDRVNVTDLKNFFMRWYGPNNAVLTVAGDVKPQEVIKLAEKYFGSIPRGPEVKPQVVTPITLKENRYISYEDNIRMPQIIVAYPTVADQHPDAPALQVLADILSSGNNSLFYQHFVKSQKAVAATCYHRDAELAGIFQNVIRAYPDTKLSDMQKLLDSTMMIFEKKGVNTEDVEKFMSKYEIQIIEELSSIQGKGSLMAAMQTFRNNPDYLTEEMEKFKKVSPADVMRVYNAYIKGKGSVTLSIVPKGKKDLIVNADNFQKPNRNIEEESPEYKNLSYTAPTDNFDRSIKPAAGPNPLIKVPEFYTSKLSNGISVTGSYSDEIPTVTMMINLPMGHRHEELKKAGVAYLTANLMNESTTKHSSEEIETMLDKLGSTVYFSAGDDELSIYVNTKIKNIDATLNILEEKLFFPKFAEDEFNLFKKQQLENIRNQSTQPQIVANNVYAKLIFGTDQSISLPTIGNAYSVFDLTINDVKEWYKNAYTPVGASITISGKVEQEVILKKLTFLSKWKGKAPLLQKEKPAVLPEATKIYFVHRDKAPQSQVRIGYLSIPYDATGEFYKSKLMNYPLAGAFNSRINLNLREDKGYTYGAKGGMTGTIYSGPYTFFAGVKADATDLSIIEFMKEIKNYAENGPTKEELIFVQNSIGQSEALDYETPAQKLSFIKNITQYQLPKDFVSKQTQILQTMSVEEMQQRAKKMLPYNNMHIVVVGDKNVCLEKLKKLGYEVIELNSEGQPEKQ